jgi:prolipoprotein diacylglyceryltransferase
MNTSPIIHHPFAYQWGWFQFTGFGLAVLLAFAIAQIIAQHELARRGHDPEPIGDLLFAAIVGTLIGAILTGMIANGLTLMSVSPYLTPIITGAVLILVIWINLRGKGIGPLLRRVTSRP